MTMRTHLDDHDGLLNDVGDLRLDQLEEDVDAAVGGALDLDSADANGAHGLADKVHVDLGGVPEHTHGALCGGADAPRQS